MDSIKCPHCGKKTTSKNNKCDYCDKPLDEKAGKKIKIKKIVTISILVLFLIFGGIISYLFVYRSYVGIWENNIIYKVTDNLNIKTYEKLELKYDDTFTYHFYDINGDKDYKYNGTYNKKKDVIYLYFEGTNDYNSLAVYMHDDKLCIQNRDCKDYLIKSSDREKNTITLGREDLPDYFEKEEEKNNVQKKEVNIMDCEETSNQVSITILNAGWCEDCDKLIDYINNTIVPKYKDKVKVTIYDYDENYNYVKAIANRFNHGREFDKFNSLPIYIIGHSIITGYQDNKVYNTTIIKNDIDREIKKKGSLDLPKCLEKGSQ